MPTKSSTLRLVSVLVPLIVSLSPFDGAHAFDARLGASSVVFVLVQMKEEPLAVGSEITIKSYDSETGTYIIFPTKFPGEGEGSVSPKALAQSVKAIDLTEITRDPLGIVGKQYRCDAALELISWEG